MNRAKEINKLHSEVCEGARMILLKAIRAGELLVEQKAELKHGEWIPWVKAKLVFDIRQTQRYIRCYKNRAKYVAGDVFNSLTDLIGEKHSITPRKQITELDETDLDERLEGWEEEPGNTERNVSSIEEGYSNEELIKAWIAEFFEEWWEPKLGKCDMKEQAMFAEWIIEALRERFSRELKMVKS
jgi:hypothetical protein